MASNAERVSKKFIGAVEDEWQLYSDRSTDYTLGAPIGFGASSIVYAARYHPPGGKEPIPCALKVLDLDTLPQHALSLLHRETHLMSLSKHPNVIRVRGSWIDGHKLYIAMRLMNKGSAADVMRYGWPGGMEEEVVRCILKQALEGLNYLHMNGLIHRDIKAANFLIDDDGTVLLGDLGVAASLVDDHHDHPKMTSHSRRINFDTSTASSTTRPIVPHVRPKMGKRKSFVGTPCWMAPELIQGKQYDASADIWSFGITALELAQGRPPRSRESPQSVLLQTVQGAPPTLDRDGGEHKYSKAFKDVVESCLVKDPSQRPTAAQLLQNPFFKNAKKKSYLTGTILNGLPPLTQRQERRKRPASIIQGTIDSWDFSMTASPTTSLYKRPVFVRKTSIAEKPFDESTPVVASGDEFDFDPELDAQIVSPVEGVKMVKVEHGLVMTPREIVPSPPEAPSSPSSLDSSPSPTGETTSVATSLPSITDTRTNESTPVASIPIPRQSDTPFNANFHQHPSSNPDNSLPSFFSGSNKISSKPVNPSTSAPSNPAGTPPSSAPRLWRKLTGNSSGQLKGDNEKSRKSSFSRKASDALIRTRSRAAQAKDFLQGSSDGTVR